MPRLSSVAATGRVLQGYVVHRLKLRSVDVAMAFALRQRQALKIAQLCGGRSTTYIMGSKVRSLMDLCTTCFVSDHAGLKGRFHDDLSACQEAA